MVRKTTAMLILFAMVTTATALAQQNGRRGAGGQGAHAQNEGMDQVLAGIPAAELSQIETDGLLLMREEEKLARDVYDALAEAWGVNIFGNIARSEQTHMDAIGLLMDRYGIKDLIADDSHGVFANPELQRLYDDLVDKGSVSLTEALKVGALIEDLDIADLERLIGQTDNDDIKIVYQNLTKGSRNHLRSFYAQIQRYGAAYSAQYISAAALETIVTSARETGQTITDPGFVFQPKPTA